MRENNTGQWAVKYLQCLQLDRSKVPPSVAIRLSICRGVGVFINKQRATCCVGREVRLFISSSLLCGISREGAPRRLAACACAALPRNRTPSQILKLF